MLDTFSKIKSNFTTGGCEKYIPLEKGKVDLIFFQENQEYFIYTKN
jgi:hypothetical protein